MRRIATHTSLIMAFLFAFAAPASSAEWNLESELITSPLPDTERTLLRLQIASVAVVTFYDSKPFPEDNLPSDDRKGFMNLMNDLMPACTGVPQDELIPLTGDGDCISAFNIAEAAAIKMSQTISAKLTSTGEPSTWAPSATLAPPPPTDEVPTDRAAVQAAVGHQLGDLPEDLQTMVVEAVVGDEPPPATDDPVLDLVLDLANDFAIPELDPIPTEAEELEEKIGAATVALMERAEEMGATDPTRAEAAINAARKWGGDPPSTPTEPVSTTTQPLVAADATEIDYAWLIAIREPIEMIPTDEPEGAKDVSRAAADTIRVRFNTFRLACETSPPQYSYDGKPLGILVCMDINESIISQLAALEMYKHDYEQRAIAALSPEPQAQQPALQLTTTVTQPMPAVVQSTPTVDDFADSCADGGDLYNTTYAEAEVAHQQILELTARGPVVASSARRVLEKYSSDELETTLAAFDGLLAYHRDHRITRMVTSTQLRLGTDAHKRKDCDRLAAFHQSRTTEVLAFDTATLRVLEAAHAAVLAAKGDSVAQTTVDHLMAVAGQTGNPFYNSMVATAH